MPRVLRVDPSSPEPAAITEAVEVLRRGGLVAFPTETVYGLGARGLHAEEVATIFVAKGRPPTHPLILHADGEAMATSVASEWPEHAVRLGRAFWPGALTLIVPRAASVPAIVSGGRATVGVRVPAHPVALALVRMLREPIAAPSANAHTRVSPTTAEHVVRSLGDAVDLVLDAGATMHGIESTVVDVSSDPPCVLRPGALSLAQLQSVVPEVVYRDVTAARDVARASPGLAAKHYSPRARVVSVDAAAGVGHALSEARQRGARAGALLVTEAAARTATANGAEVIRLLGPDPVAYARDLFAALHEMEGAGCAVIIVERVPDEPAWWAVADRLRRAEAD